MKFITQNTCARLEFSEASKDKALPVKTPLIQLNKSLAIRLAIQIPETPEQAVHRIGFEHRGNVPKLLINVFSDTPQIFEKSLKKFQSLARPSPSPISHPVLNSNSHPVLKSSSHNSCPPLPKVQAMAGRVSGSNRLRAYIYIYILDSPLTFPLVWLHASNPAPPLRSIYYALYMYTSQFDAAA